MVFGTIMIYIALQIIASALTPKPPKPKPPEVGEVKVPTVDPSRKIPVVFGTVVIKSPAVLWYGDLSTTPIYSEEDGSK